jgi:hypothetical protein
MLDSKQLALVYLMEESNKMSSLCAKNIHSTNKKKLNSDIEKQIGSMFNAMKEVADEFKVEEQNVEKHLLEEIERRNKER